MASENEIYTSSYPNPITYESIKKIKKYASINEF